jgi:hypothetical protein
MFVVRQEQDDFDYGDTHSVPGVRRDPKVLRRVSRILIKEGLHFANLFCFRVESH